MLRARHPPSAQRHPLCNDKHAQRLRRSQEQKASLYFNMAATLRSAIPALARRAVRGNVAATAHRTTARAMGSDARGDRLHGFSAPTCVVLDAVGESWRVC